ncbi:MAG: TIGR01244 family sulfur transferase [Paracoccaceae bacterium]
MEARSITPRYFVSPQISVEDVPAIAAAGFTTVLCNRPDCEVPSSHQAAAIQEAVEAAGLTFHVLELTHQTMTPENIALQRSLAENCEGPVLAYCASGTRCSVVWALGHVCDAGVEGVLEQTRQAGYQLDGLRPQLEITARDDQS